jgi:hypothetical protein
MLLGSAYPNVKSVRYAEQDMLLIFVGGLPDVLRCKAWQIGRDFLL